MNSAEKTKCGLCSRFFSYFSMFRQTCSPNYFAFLLMRITGVCLVAFLFIHMWTVGQIIRGKPVFDSAMQYYNNPVGWFLEYMLFLAVLYHMFNGLRLMAADFLSLTEKQSGMLWIVVGATAIVAAAALKIFFPVSLLGIS